MSMDSFLAWLTRHGRSVSTPAYIYDETELDRSLVALAGLLPERAPLFYSLKANPQPGIVELLAARKVGAEVASAGEWRACRMAGVPAADIVVGGVGKTGAFLAEVAAARPAAVVIDSLAEWTRAVSAFPSGAGVPVLLRINPGVRLGGLDMGGASQFGLDPEQGLEVARLAAQSSRVDLLGLHAYFGSQRLKATPIVQTIRVVGGIIEDFARHGLRPRVVDIGLGVGVPYLADDEEPDLRALQAALHDEWRRDAWSGIKVWSEAGRALVARSGYFVARVTEAKDLNGKTFVFLDGGLGVHNPGVGLGRFFRKNPQFAFVPRAGGSPAPTGVVDIVGNLCTSADCLGHQVPAPDLEEGDLVVIPNAGAYCQTTGLWGFNSQRPFSEALLAADGGLLPWNPQHHVLFGA